MAKFQVGDTMLPTKKVIIPGIGWGQDMDSLLNTPMTVDYVATIEGVECYRAKENGFYWPEDCFDLSIPLPATPSDAAPIEELAEESEAARRYREKIEFRRAIGRIS